MRNTGTPHFTDLAASIEQSAVALAAVLDPSRNDHAPRVSPTQLRVLTWLRAHPRTNVNGLADFLEVNPSSASRLCDRLEALGLLRRTGDRRDRREVQVIVTPQAVGMLDDMSRLRRHAVGQVLAMMPESARQELARSLIAFSLAADAASEEDDTETDLRSA
jgi:DNA-binding MarR family transcriptional regulator